MRPSLVAKRLAVLFRNHEAVLLKGQPGVCKTELIRQAAREIEADLLISHPVVKNPTHYTGLPGIVNGMAEFLPYGDLRAMMTATKLTVVLFDDLGQASTMVRAAVMQLVLEREIDGKRISDHIVFAAATNRRQDQCGVTGMEECVKGRFITIIEVTPNMEDWVTWAVAAGVDPIMVAFCRDYRPDCFDNWKPTNDISNTCTPRTAVAASRLIGYGFVDAETLSGAIGEGYGVDLAAYCRAYQSMPSIKGILDDPDSATVPSDPAVTYAVVGALIFRSSNKVAKNIIKYAKRLSPEFGMLLVRGSAKHDEGFTECGEYAEYMVKNQGYAL